MHSRLLFIRKDVLKLTQQQFSDELGIDRTSLSQYEHGNTALPKYISRLICRTFNISEKWLEAGEGSIFVSETKQENNTVTEPANIYNDRPYLRDIINLLVSNPDLEEHAFHYLKSLTTKPRKK